MLLLNIAAHQHGLPTANDPEAQAGAATTPSVPTSQPSTHPPSSLGGRAPRSRQEQGHAVPDPRTTGTRATADETVRRTLLHECDMHTLLRLPTGVFYAQGVKANVLFFDRRAGSETAATVELWIYDLRTNQHLTLKQHPLTRADLDDWIECYHPQSRHEREETWSEGSPGGRWRRFTYEELMAREKANLPEPDVLAEEIVEDHESALEQFRAILANFGEG